MCIAKYFRNKKKEKVYIYKLVDDEDVKRARKGLISLSHPIFEFKGSEGRFISFARRIYERFQKQGLNVKPLKKDLEEIKEWMETFIETDIKVGPAQSDNENELKNSPEYISFMKELKKTEPYRNVCTEAMIIFCGIFQTYCGYFTTEKLDDKKTLKEFIDKFNLSSKKIAVLKIDESVVDKQLQWRTESLSEPFERYKGDSNDLRNFNGFTHPTKIIYLEKYDDYHELLKNYNNDAIRSSHWWFDNLPKEFENQKEERIIFLLRSLNKGESRLACDNIYKRDPKQTSFEYQFFCSLIDAFVYYEKNAPKYISLNLKRKNIKMLVE